MCCCSYFIIFSYIVSSMGRGGSRSASRGSSSPSRSSFAASRPAPAPTQQAPMQQPQTAQRTGVMGGIGSTIMQGMAFGAGSEVAHQAVRSFMGGSSHQTQPQEHQQQQQQPQQQQQNPCQVEIQNFSQCIQRNSDLSYCQSLSDMLKTSKPNNGLL